MSNQTYIMENSTKNLWKSNTPDKFWRCLPPVTVELWEEAVKKATPQLNLPVQTRDIEQILMLTLGEAQFGLDHWRLSRLKRAYYLLKPILPRPLTRLLRQMYSAPSKQQLQLTWPIEDRFARFMWDIMRHLLELSDQTEMPFIHFWPEGRRTAFVITHDIETAAGQEHVLRVADIEEQFGFRSSFNYIPERYSLDANMMQELRERGFEIGVHGLKHDGKLFNTREAFENRVVKINQYLQQFDAVGFRAPLTHRHPEWMQSLNIEYDLSFFDTDPYEPIPGGTMAIWPFEIGSFLELPYTLVQDYTLFNVLGEKHPLTWMNKIDFLEQYHGLILVNVHPDYLLKADNWTAYTEFLQEMKLRNNYWHALPRDTAAWWRSRFNASSISDLPGAVSGLIKLNGKEIIVE